MARILLIDDDPDVLGGLSRVLGKLGHEVRPTKSGREALRVLGGGVVDLVITDINMPDIDGIELIMAVRDGWPGLPVIAISGGGRLPSDLLLANAGVLGACITLPKPVGATSLADAVAQALTATSAVRPTGWVIR